MRTLQAPCLALLAAAAVAGCATGPGLDPGRDTRGVPPSASPMDDGGLASASDAAVPAEDASAPTSTPPPAPPPGPAPTPGVSVPPLPCGRTYDQQTAYFVRSPGAAYVTMQHRDDTTLPADEGSVACSGRAGCSENVTRLADGESLEGVIWNVDTLTFQAAAEHVAGVGSVRFEACGGTVTDDAEYASSGTLPGFANSVPFHLPPGETCVFRLTAHGGFVDVRAVTTTCSSPPPPSPNQP